MSSHQTITAVLMHLMEGVQKEGNMCGASYTRGECKANRNAFLFKQMPRSICFPLGLQPPFWSAWQDRNCSKNSLFMYNMVVLTAQQIVAYFYLSSGSSIDGEGRLNKTLQLADGAFHYCYVEWSQHESIMQFLFIKWAVCFFLSDIFMLGWQERL